MFPHDTLTLKVLAERAFRAPSPTELFVANTLLGSSNTERLRPEQMTTLTVAGDFTPFSRLTLRADWFYQRFENQIAFSATQNLSANIYSRTITGAEAEGAVRRRRPPPGGPGHPGRFRQLHAGAPAR